MSAARNKKPVRSSRPARSRAKRRVVVIRWVGGLIVTVMLLALLGPAIFGNQAQPPAPHGVMR